MRLDFIYLIVDFLKISFSERHWFTEWLIPLIFLALSIMARLYCGSNDSYSLVCDLIGTIKVLLGFTLASLTLFLGRTDSKMKEIYAKGIKVRGKRVSLHQIMLITLSYLILVETLLCLGYYVGLLFPNVLGYWGCLIMNTLFVFFSFHLFMVLIRAITNIYFMNMSQE